MHKPQGGTEILYDNLAKRIDLSGVNLIKSVCAFELLHPNKPNILWQHLSYDQDNVRLLANPEYVKRLDAIVFVSHWQHEQFRKRFNLPGEKCHVIQNAVNPYLNLSKPKGKIRLIYTSTPWRGLEVLAKAYKKLNRDDVELVVYSGTSIYGQSFYEQEHPKYIPIYNELMEAGAIHHEYASNDEVRKALQEAHILAYPNIWEETSCLAAIEALMTGCKVVTTNFGALYETCGTWADYVTLDSNLVDRYADALNKAIDTFWEQGTQDKLADQVAYYQKYWTWDSRIKQWEQLIDSCKLCTQVQAA